jgi:hypothetical protein
LPYLCFMGHQARDRSRRERGAGRGSSQKTACFLLRRTSASGRCKAPGPDVRLSYLCETQRPLRENCLLSPCVHFQLHPSNSKFEAPDSGFGSRSCPRFPPRLPLTVSDASASRSSLEPGRKAQSPSPFSDDQLKQVPGSVEDEHQPPELTPAPPGNGRNGLSRNGPDPPPNLPAPTKLSG